MLELKRNTKTDLTLPFILTLELADEGGIQEVGQMLEVNLFVPIDAVEGKYLGGVAFSYDFPTLNKANHVEIYGQLDGKRTMKWYALTKDRTMKRLVDKATDIAPADMERTWWEHTQCNIRKPVFFKTYEQFRDFTHGVEYAVLSQFTRDECQMCYGRHLHGDWGDADEELRMLNERNLDPEAPGNLRSIFRFPDGRELWITTNWTRTHTTVSLPYDETQTTPNK